MKTLLKEGDLVGIVAPASPFDRKKFHRGIKTLQKLGFKTVFKNGIFAKEGYLAGSDLRRAQELKSFFANRKVKAIFAARGGYGSQRILPHLNKDFFKNHRKPIIGYSDLTALLTFLRQEAKIPTLYGPVVALLGRKISPRTLSTLKWQLTKNRPLPPIILKPAQILKTGTASGMLVGGCLTLITSGLKTPYELKTDGTILFLEDTGEKVYTLDRMITHLQSAGKLKKVRGIIFGTLNTAESSATKKMLQNSLKNFRGPIVFNFPSGHTQDFVSLPLGKKVRIDMKKKKLFFLEPFLR